MGVRAGKQHTTQTNRLGARNGKPEGNPDDIGRTTQSRDWTFSCGSWREGKGRNPNPCNIKSVLQENRAWPVREFSMEKRWLWWKGALLFHFLALTPEAKHSWGCCKWNTTERGKHFSPYPAWKATWAQQTSTNTPCARRDTRRPPRASPDWARTEENLEKQEGPEQKCPRLRGSGWVSTSPPGQGAPAGAALLLQHIKSEHHRNLNIAERLTEAKYYPIKLGLSVNVSYIHRIVNCSYI